jgi:hypothetical protein
MNGDDADRPARDYRAATDALEERPSAATRAAILAAAARQVRATPRDAVEPIGRRVVARSRWPLAAAAAVLLSTLTVMLAVRTEQEMPTFTPPTAGTETHTQVAEVARAEQKRAEVQAPPEAPPQDHLPAPLAKRAQSADTFAATSAETGAAGGPASVAPAVGKDAHRARDAAPQLAAGESKVTVPLAEPRAKEEVAGLRAPAAPPAPSVDASSEFERAAATRADAAKPEGVPAEVAASERRRNELADSAAAARGTLRQAPAGALTGKARTEADTVTTGELRAEDWLEKIVKLRKSGRHDEADAELKRFRERYPQIQVPADALPPSGTR